MPPKRKYGKLINDLILTVPFWQPKNGPMTADADASSHLMSVCNLMAGELRRGGFPVKVDGLTVFIMEAITRKSSVWAMYYAAGKGHDPAKLRRTVIWAIEYTEEEPPAQPAMMDEDDGDEPEDAYDYEAEDAVIADLTKRAPAPLQSLVTYCNAIAPIYQPLFALTAALMATGVVLARNWITTRLVFENGPVPASTTNDYYAFIAPTGHGKDIIKTDLTDAIDNEYITPASGASSRSALHKKLQINPRTILLMDEAGKRLAESGRDQSGIKQEAETMIMEIYGNTGYVEPQEYADNKDSPYPKRIKRHGLSVGRLSTPETFAAAVPYSAVKDGWMSRHIVVVSYRQRPKTLGTYHPEGATSDPKDLLDDWIVWRKAHLGMPKADTYRQIVSPVTAVEWGYGVPEDVMIATKEMRSRITKFTTHREVVVNDPITLKWDDDAAEEIGKIYAEIEATPPDNYTCMKYRKLAHIVKHAAMIAVLRDEVTIGDMWDIRQKYTDTEKGRELVDAEKETKAAYKRALKEYDFWKESKATNKEAVKLRKEAEQEMNKALDAYTKARDKAEFQVWGPIRREAAAKLQSSITVEDVRWARDFIDLVEGPARKLVIEELTNLGYADALDRMIEFLKRHDGSATESRITHKCTAVKRLDERGLLKPFFEYAQDTGLVICDKPNNRGRRWYLATSEPPTQPPAAPPQRKTIRPRKAPALSGMQASLPAEKREWVKASYDTVTGITSAGREDPMRAGQKAGIRSIRIRLHGSQTPIPTARRQNCWILITRGGRPVKIAMPAQS